VTVVEVDRRMRTLEVEVVTTGCVVCAVPKGTEADAAALAGIYMGVRSECLALCVAHASMFRATVRRFGGSEGAGVEN
jgi:hypothetical protein